MSESLHLFDIDFDIIPYGQRAIILRPRVQLEDPLTLPRIGEYLVTKAPPGIADVVATPTELVIVPALSTRKSELGDWVIGELTNLFAACKAVESNPSRTFRLPVLFDEGSDWDRVHEETGFAREAYVHALTRARLVLTMYGFIPGFLYMSGLPVTLRCARKSVPTTRCKAGSVAVGGPYFGIYGLESPAGWNIIGCTPIRTTQVHQLPPTPFRVGDVFQIEPIGAHTFDQLQADQPEITELQIDD